MEGWSAVARVYDPLKAGSIDATDTEPHDKGIVRALKAKYKCHATSDPEKTIFIGRLNFNTSQDTIEERFKTFGKITQIRLVRDIVTNFSRGYAFIEYEHRKDAREAIRKMNHVTIDDKHIIVLWECQRTLPNWVPRRLGGGFGGKKESGQLRFGGEEKPWRKPILVPLISKNFKNETEIRFSKNEESNIRDKNDGNRCERHRNQMNRSYSIRSEKSSHNRCESEFGKQNYYGNKTRNKEVHSRRRHGSSSVKSHYHKSDKVYRHKDNDRGEKDTASDVKTKKNSPNNKKYKNLNKKEHFSNEDKVHVKKESSTKNEKKKNKKAKKSKKEKKKSQEKNTTSI